MQVAMIHARSGFPTTSQRLCKWDARSKVKQMISTNSTSFVTIIALRHWLTRKCVNLVFTYWCDLMTTYIHLPQSYARNKILIFIDWSFYIKSSRNISSVKRTHFHDHEKKYKLLLSIYIHRNFRQIKKTCLDIATNIELKILTT